MAEDELPEKDVLLKELDEIEAELKAVRPRRALSFPYLGAGLLFFILFIVTLYSQVVLVRALGVISFLIALVALLRVGSDIAYAKSWTPFSIMVFGGVILFAGIGIALLWTQVLASITTILLILLFILFVMELVFFLIHAYIAYLHKHSNYEIQVTAIIALFYLILLLAAFLYSHIIIYLLLLIAAVLFTKALADFSTRFRKEN